MAIVAAARVVFRSPAARNAVSRVASEAKATCSPFRIASRSPLAPRIFRRPAELIACVESMQPYHTATASALMTSMLTVSPRSFGWLAEAMEVGESSRKRVRVTREAQRERRNARSRLAYHTLSHQRQIAESNNGSRESFAGNFQTHKVCFAMTINKAQGQTLDTVGIYLREPVFSHGQLYVAMSRARKADSIRMVIYSDDGENKLTNITNNVVYQEILEYISHTPNQS